MPGQWPRRFACAYDGKEFTARTQWEIWWAMSLPCCSLSHQLEVLHQELQAVDAEDAEAYADEKEMEAAIGGAS